jgi:hypothetical protein
MPSINQAQPDLTSGETIVWAGRPKFGVVFHKGDLFLIPFSLLWGGFAIFWEAGVSGAWVQHSASSSPSWFMQLWGVPFVLVGQYLIWGRFVYAAWMKKRTHYAVTNRRIIVVQDGWTRQTASAFLDTLPALIKEGGMPGVGTLRFAQPQSARRGWGSWNSMSIGDSPAFKEIEDADAVYRLVSDLREKARTTRPSY